MEQKRIPTGVFPIVTAESEAKWQREQFRMFGEEITTDYRQVRALPEPKEPPRRRQVTQQCAVPPQALEPDAVLEVKQLRTDVGRLYQQTIQARAKEASVVVEGSRDVLRQLAELRAIVDRQGLVLTQMAAALNKHIVTVEPAWVYAGRRLNERKAWRKLTPWQKLCKTVVNPAGFTCALGMFCVAALFALLTMMAVAGR